MYEGDDRGKTSVVVDDVSEVSHAFVAFVVGCDEAVAGWRVYRWIDGIDSVLPAVEGLSQGLGESFVEEGHGTYSGKYSATQLVFSCSSLAMTTILSSGLAGTGGGSAWAPLFMEVRI